MVSPLYSVCLMSVLTAHEFGHYFAAQHYRVPASLPYFIPFPTLFGTMGAVIRMSPLIPNRRALFDIAAAGPIAGAMLAIPLSFTGIMLSERVSMGDDVPGITLGDSMLFLAFERILHGPAAEGVVLMLHPVGFAGWTGLFVTALNLLPIGQLDGGHVAYSVFGSRSVRVAVAAFVILASVCIWFGTSYLMLLVLLLLMGIRHRPTVDDSVALGRTRTRMAMALLALFALCFTPTPVDINF